MRDNLTIQTFRASTASVDQKANYRGPNYNIGGIKYDSFTARPFIKRMDHSKVDEPPVESTRVRLNNDNWEILTFLKGYRISSGQTLASFSITYELQITNKQLQGPGAIRRNSISVLHFGRDMQALLLENADWLEYLLEHTTIGEDSNSLWNQTPEGGAYEIEYI